MSHPDDRTRLNGAADDDVTRLGSREPARGQLGRLTPDQVFGPFRIVRELGRGGMGEVYEGQHLETGRRLALKILSGSFTDREIRDRFLREGRLAASVSHPNSVYIYGSHDIDGVPAISMELVGGGTLQELVEARGRLAPVEAVGAVLQLIAGLEAAESRGVLHRDIKPSNAFVDANGVLKIGDYGLSLSVASADETRLTTAGMFIGTPAYASPEQVRGVVVDVRSDLYSVGATLYFLLTGRSPFDRGNAMQTLAAVLAEDPVSPRQLVADVPSSLADIVLRSLRKDPSQRFSSYASLREALLPYSERTIPAARLSHRFAAMLVDGLIFTPIVLGFGLIVLGTPVAASSGPIVLAAYGLLELAYFGVLEGRYGGSIGKRIYGLRVVTTAGQPVTFARATGRAAIWVLMLTIGDLIANQRFPVAVVLFFITARKSKGYRGPHEILSGTRTVRVAPAWSIRRRHAARAAETPSDRTGRARAGAFVVHERLWEFGSEALDEAWDPALERAIWIHRVPTGSPAVSAAREQLARESRLRWIAGRRGPDENWDAYEAPYGRALAVLPWHHTLSVVKDLAIELERGLADGSLPALLSTSRVWVGEDGVARIAEFDLPLAPQAEPMTVADVRSSQTFLYAIVLSGLGGGLANTPMPLAVRAALDDLGAGKFSSLAAFVDRLDEAARSAPSVSKPRRFLALAFGSFVAAFTLIVTLMTTRDAYTLHQEPQLEELGLLTARLQFLEDEGEPPANQWMSRHPDSRYTPEERRAFRIYLGDRFSSLIADRSAWDRLDNYWDDLDDKREFAEQASAEAAKASPEDRRQAQTGADRILDDFNRRQRERSNFWLDQMFRVQSVLGQALAVVGVFAVVLALLTGGSIVLRILGLGIAGPDGRRASWLRAWSRSVVAWLPALFGYAVFLFGLSPIDIHAAVAPSVLAVTNAIMIAGFALTAWRPDLAVQDRIAGTRVVPK